MSAPGNELSPGQYADSGSVDHRPGPPNDNTNWAAQDPRLIYSQVQTADPTQVGSVADSWGKIGDALYAVNEVLSTGAGKGAAGWTGSAARSALGFHTQVAQWTAVAAQASYQAGGNVSLQSDAASTAKYSMPQPMNYGVTQAFADFAANPLSVGTIHDKLDQAQQNNEQIRQVARQYDTSLVQSSQRMPALGPTPTFGSPGGGTPTPKLVSPPVHGGPGGTGTVPRTSPGGGGIGATGPTSGGGGSSAGGHGLTTPAPLIQTTPQAAGGPFGGSGGPGLPGGGSPAGGSPTGGSPTDGGLGFVPGGPMGAGGGFGGGDPAVGDPAVGDPAVGGGGRFGGGAAGSAGRGLAGGRSGAGEPGGRGAAGAMSAAEEALEGRSAGAPGPGGFGGMGAGRGNRDEDHEHRRPSYLVENDPDSVFGTGERTAPPVIGG